MAGPPDGKFGMTPASRNAPALFVVLCSVVLTGTFVLFGTGGALRSLLGGDAVVRGAFDSANPYSSASPDEYATVLPRDLGDLTDSGFGDGRYYPPTYDPRAYTASDGTDASCDDVLLFLPSSNVRTVEGQLAAYLVAMLAATFADHALVLLDDPADDLFGSGGLASIIEHPAELSRRCPIPCAGTFGHEDWEARSWPGPATPVLCDESTAQNVLVINGDTAASYLDAMAREISDRSTGEAVSSAFRWASRLGARADEASVLSTMTDGREILDYASGLLARSGLLRFRPKVAEDVAAFVGQYGRGAHQWDAVVMTDERIPLTSYLSRLTDECRHHEVYVATDSTASVRAQIASLPKHKKNGHATLNKKRGCVTFTFGVVSPIRAAEPSWSPYQNTVMALSQLIVLARSRRVVADPGSRDVYALLRFFRRRIRESHGVMRSRSAGGDEGGDGPTYVEGLDAVVDGAANGAEAEIYDVGPRSKYGDVQKWSDAGAGADSLYGSDGGRGLTTVSPFSDPSGAVSESDGGGSVQQDDDSPAIQFYIKSSGEELYLNRAR